MSGANTAHWLYDICRWLSGGQSGMASIQLVNLLLRKLGHFCGYGSIALLFRRAWFITLSRSWQGSPSRLPFSAAALSVICTFAVASADEMHQRFLSGRKGSIYDVLLDTAGAILFNRLFVLLASRRLESTPA